MGLFSKTKTGIRKLRSFQRLITITLTNSFKTASTESLLVLASVIPIDYHVLEIAAAHSFFVCDKIRPFSKSSLKLLAQRFPSIVSRNTAVKASSVYNSPVPPWDMRSNITKLGPHDCVDIMPTGRETVRYYVTFLNSKDGMGCCFGTSTYSSIEDVTHIAIFSRQSDFKQVAHTPLSTIFAHIQRVYSTKYIEIYTDSMESLTWANPSHNLSELEIQILTLFYPVKERCSLFCCPNTNLVARLNLAREKESLLLISLAVGSITPTTKDRKNELHSTVRNLWNSEWHQLLKGSTTKRFFPTIVDAHSIKSRSLPSHLSQILTGHSLLNDHQYRLNFVTSPECACGCNIENIDHFLFHCARFNSQRERVL